jgi:hypothetical protein
MGPGSLCGFLKFIRTGSGLGSGFQSFQNIWVLGPGSNFVIFWEDLKHYQDRREGGGGNFHRGLGLKGGPRARNPPHFESYFVILRPKKCEISSNIRFYVEV